MLANVKIATKIAGGFAVVIVLLLVVAVASYIGLGGAQEDFGEYRALARQSNAGGEIETAMLETRLFAKNFLINGDDKSAAAVRTTTGQVHKLIAEGRNLAREPQTKQQLDALDKMLGEYLTAFDTVVARQKEREEIFATRLNVIGPRMEKDLTALAESARRDQENDIAMRAGEVRRDMLLARLATLRFIKDENKPAAEAARAQLATLVRTAQENRDAQQDAQRREMAVKVLADATAYQQGFTDMERAVTERNKLVEEALDHIGPKVAETTDELRKRLMAQQDALGPRAAANIAQIITITLLVAGISIVVAMVAAWVIGTGISRPVVGMTQAMARLAGGDKSADIPGRGQRDEIGEMAEAVQVFKDSLIRTEQLTAEQEREHKAREARTQKVDNLTRDFDAAVASTLNTVASAATQLQ
ncbi:MAG: HAMP domain-containing protein, partial [Rhodospirillales bacterium]|nr:HAMP domain-containing protein [Rhodospirillales bacterium]